MFVYTSLHIKSEPTMWLGKTLVEGFQSHFFFYNCQCPVPSLSTLVHNCSTSSSIFSGRPVTLPLHTATSASQHPVYWHDLKGSLTAGQCFVKKAPEHKSHTAQQLWLRIGQLISISRILIQTANTREKVKQYKLIFILLKFHFSY